MPRGTNRRARRPLQQRQSSGRRGSKEGPRRIVDTHIVEQGELGDNWYYDIEEWRMSTGASRYCLAVYQVNNVGVQLARRVHFYGELRHAQAGIEKILAEAKSA
jgi:hypothetical protein